MRKLTLIGLVSILGGCVNVITPPVMDANAETVYLVDHGRHASLVLPDGQGGMVRFAYGDWRWYAEEQTGFKEGVAALFWPTKACLGQQNLTAVRSASELADAIPEGLESIHELAVPTSAALRLVAQLEAIQTTQRQYALYNPTFGLTFVPHPKPYTMFNASNQVTAEWLEELGAEVSGPAFFSIWKVRDAAATELDSEPLLWERNFRKR